MNYKDVNLEKIKNTVSEFFKNEVVNDRKIKMYTNGYGMDQFQEALDNEITPSYRIYIGKKLPRFIKNNVKNIFKSKYTSRFFKKIIKSEESNNSR